MSRERCLVTGAAGFLGRHFLAALAAEDAPVRVMSTRLRADAFPGARETVIADIARVESLPPAVAGVGRIIHLAGRHEGPTDRAEDRSASLHAVNVDGTLALARAAGAAGVERMLFVSSVKAMGEGGDEPYDETSPCRPTSEYGRTKLAAERALLDIAAETGMHVCVIRLPLVYGPGCKGNVLRLFEAAAAGRRLPLGAVRNRRSMVYAGNAAAAGLLALGDDRANGEVYLVADARDYSTAEFYGAICAALGRDPLTYNVPVPLLRLLGRFGALGEAITGRQMPLTSATVQRLTGDLRVRSDKIRRELGFRPRVDLEEGLRATADWYLRDRGFVRPGAMP